MSSFPAVVWLILCCCWASHVSALSWRVFLGREDCVSESIPENQLVLLRESFRKRNTELPENLNVAVDVGFLVTDRFGGETRGSVDVIARSPKGEVVYSNKDVKEDTFSVVSRGGHHGWEVCFKMAHTDGSTQPLTIELSFFTVNMRALLGTEHEKPRDMFQPDPVVSALDVDVASLAKSEDLGKVIAGLRSSSMQLTAVRQMVHHLKMRTERHMKTVKSTHGRTLFWSFVVAFFLISASLFQVYIVRTFFNSTTTHKPRV